MRTALIVLVSPGLDLSPRLGDRIEPVDVEAFIPKGSVERLDEGVVGGLARPAEVDPHAVMISPEIDKVAGKLGAIVGEQVFGRLMTPSF